MKKAILFIIIFCPVFAQITNITETEIKDAVSNARIIIQGIEGGFIPWLKCNWYFFLLAIIGFGQIVVKVTPSPKDNVWYDKYIIGPVRYIGRILSLGSKK